MTNRARTLERSGPRAANPPKRPPARALLALVAAAALGSGIGCGEEVGEPTRAMFDLAASQDELYAIPYPNAIRVQEDGTIDLANLRDGKTELLQLYLDQVKANTLDGFALNAAAYFRFRGPISETCLPTSPRDSMKPDAPVRWVDIDPDSPSYGQTLPLELKLTAEAGKYIGAHNLAILPLPGFALTPRTTYAVLLTEGLCDEQGDPLGPDPDFEALLGADAPEDPALARAHAAYAPLRDYLEQSGVTGVISAAVFTTGQPVDLAGRAREVIYRGDPPQPDNLVLRADTPTHWEIQGTYEAPNFQQGEPPYLTPQDGGFIEVDDKGYPVPARTEELRFAVSVPKGTMPSNGWPVVLYAHGTGGSYRTFLNNHVAAKLAEVKDASGAVIAKMAVVGIDQNLHGPRDPYGLAPEISFFNVQNPHAAINNVVQSGIDDFSLLRMIKELRVPRVEWSPDAAIQGIKEFEPPIKFDPDHIYFMGHSQGGITGPVFLAHEPEVKAAVLSGAGAVMAQSFLGKTVPVNIPWLLELMIEEPPDVFHPAINLVQQMVEEGDTANYGRLLIQHPPEGVGRKHLFVSEGFVDHYTPNDTTDALARSIGIPQAGEIIREVQGLDILGLDPLTPPLTGNLQVDGESLTAALLQYPARERTRSCKTTEDCALGDYCDEGKCHDDGHFVMFHDSRAIRQYTRFLATMIRDGTPTIVP